MAQDALQAALPREMYVDQQTWLAERETVLFGQWFCVGRLDDLGLATCSRVVVVDIVGESETPDGLLHCEGWWSAPTHGSTTYGCRCGSGWTTRWSTRSSAGRNSTNRCSHGSPSTCDGCCPVVVRRSARCAVSTP